MHAIPGIVVAWHDDLTPATTSHAGGVFHSARLLHAARASALAAGLPCPVAIIRHAGGTSIWPLRIVEQFGVSVAMDVAAPIAQYSDVIGAPLPREALEALTAALRADHGVDVLLARRVRADGGLADAFDPTQRIASDSAPFIDLGAHCDFATYEQRFGKQTRRNRNQRRRRLEQAHGRLSFEVLRCAAARAEIAQAIGWKRQWLAAQGLDSQVFDTSVHEAVLREACEDASVCVSVLRADGKPIAIEIGFTARLNYAAYLGAYDPCVARFSAGQEQMLRTIEWCFHNGFARYDLLAPANPYKAGWADDSVPVHDYCVGLSVRGNGYAMLRRIAQSPMQRRLRDLPPSVRASVRRYGLPAAGLSATAMALTLLAD